MHQYAVLRLLLAGVLLYFAWPYIPVAVTSLEKLFWGVWLGVFFLVIGGNLATLLEITEPPKIEKEPLRKRQTHNN